MTSLDVSERHVRQFVGTHVVDDECDLAILGAHLVIEFDDVRVEFAADHPGAFVACILQRQRSRFLEAARPSALADDKKWQFIGAVGICRDQHRDTLLGHLFAESVRNCLRYQGKPSCPCAPSI